MKNEDTTVKTVPKEKKKNTVVDKLFDLVGEENIQFK